MKTHVIDGKTYVEVDRKAKVGDMVVIVDDQIVEHKGLIGIVEIAYSDSYASVNVGNTVDYYPYVAHNEYRVLEPVETVDTTQVSSQVLDMLANLARRVTSLEQQLRDTQGNTEKLGEEIATITQKQRQEYVKLKRLIDEQTHPKETVEPPLLFVQNETGNDFTVYQDGKEVRGIRSVTIRAAWDEATTHEIEYLTGATGGNHQ